MNKKANRFVLLAVLVILIGVAGWWVYSHYFSNTQVFDKDTTIQGDYTIAPDHKTVLKNGALLTVTGNLTVAGSLGCDHGPVQMNVMGALHVSNEINCQSTPSDQSGQGIAIVAQGDVQFDKNSSLQTDGAIQLVDRPEKLVMTQEQIDAVYDEVVQPTGGKFRIGPMNTDVNKKRTAAVDRVTGASMTLSPSLVQRMQAQMAQVSSLVPVARADSAAKIDRIDIQGKWGIPPVKQQAAPKPDKEGKAPALKGKNPTTAQKVASLIINVGNGAEVNLDGEIYGENGTDGYSDLEANCKAQGGAGHDGSRIFISADNLVIGNADILLGDGGRGGDAESSTKCDQDVSATGGTGGMPGNFKIVVSDSLLIKGALTIHPGFGGSGGIAMAVAKSGKDGCPGKNGYNATATGGDGGVSDKDLNSAGNVGGTANIVIDTKYAGGDGGWALANAGYGGSGNKPGCAGGDGGNAYVYGGNGGFSHAIGGNGGDMYAYGGQGGYGASCDRNTPKGGNGGRGGSGPTNNLFSAMRGLGGIANGEEGSFKEVLGGNGGRGGDGPGFGTGGKGGDAVNPGKDGQNGGKACVEEPENPGNNGPPPTDNPTPGTDTGPTKPLPPPSGGGDDSAASDGFCDSNYTYPKNAVTHKKCSVYADCLPQKCCDAASLGTSYCQDGYCHNTLIQCGKFAPPLSCSPSAKGGPHCL